MTAPLFAGLITALAVAWIPSQADPPGQSVTPASKHLDFKVVVWYRRDRPLETFQSQEYDVRKGQYTPAVEQWLELMKTRYPGYVLIVRNVDLEHERGATEGLRVGAVIKRELMAAAALEGVVVGAPAPGLNLRSSNSLAGKGGSTAPPGAFTPLGASRSGSLNLGPTGPSFPVPMPYPRPHP